jgi:hypothetical protein
MARFNEILVGRFNRALQKLLSMKGPASLVTLSDEVFPALVINDFLADTFYLFSWELFAKSGTVAGVAAQNSAIRYRNPKGSNVVALFLQVAAHSSVANEIFTMEWQTSAATDFGTILATTVQNIDNRTRPSTTLIVSSGNNVAAAQFGVQRAIPSVNQTVDFLNTDVLALPLLPDSSLTIRTNNQNTNLSANCIWRERALEESELK